MEKNKVKKEKKRGQIISTIQELMKTPRGRGILFFGAYFIFFLILILIVRFGSRGDVIGTGYEKGRPYQFSITNILNKNYKFHYQILWDQNKFLYEGSKNNSNELFTKSTSLETLSYFRNSYSFLQQIDNLWIKADNPYYFEEFFNEENISNILDQASYVSKTEYESGKVTYHFQISTSTLMLLFTGDDIDISDNPNDITISTDSSSEVSEITFSLDSYCKYLNRCTEGLRIQSKYDSFGEVQEISNPMD